jgi:hypothetical protein
MRNSGGSFTVATSIRVLQGSNEGDSLTSDEDRRRLSFATIAVIDGL